VNGNIEKLILLSLSLRQRVRYLKERSFVPLLRQATGKKPDIIIIRGLRGVGKTTGMLQVHASLNDRESIYFSADWPQVRKEGLYETALTLVEMGYRYLFIDEVHTYPGWMSIVKALNDQFDHLKMIISGSAAIAFTQDRRFRIIDVAPLSLREYILLTTGEDIKAPPGAWKDAHESSRFVGQYYPEIKHWIETYMRVGGFPFSLNMDEEDALKALFSGISKSIREDSMSILKMDISKAFAMEKLLYFIATSPPGEANITSLSRNLGKSKDTVYEIIEALSKMKILRVVTPMASGSAIVRKEPKLLLQHPDLRYAICKELGIEASRGALREEAVLFALESLGIRFGTVKGVGRKKPDYMLEDGTVIEIGGESKGLAQLKGFEKTLLIRDNQIITLLLSY